MKKLMLLLSVAVLPNPLFSATEFDVFKIFPQGHQEVLKEKSKGQCPEIDVVHQSLDDGKKLLMLNPRLVFDLSLLSGQQSEKVPEGCHYQHSLKVKNNVLTKITSRFDCPKASENGVYKESLKSTSNGFEFKSTLNDKEVLNCLYSKGGK